MDELTINQVLDRAEDKFAEAIKEHGEDSDCVYDLYRTIAVFRRAYADLTKMIEV